MFCEVTRSSALSTRPDPEEQADIIAAFHTCCAKEVATLGGREHESGGALQGIAEPNSIGISPVTHRLVCGLFNYRDLGRHTLKGFAEPVLVRDSRLHLHIRGGLEVCNAFSGELASMCRHLPLTIYVSLRSTPDVRKLIHGNYEPSGRLAL